MRSRSTIRIALFHPSLVTGGIQRVFVNLARGFVERGYDVHLVQATPGGDFRHAVPQGVRIVDLHAGRALTSVLPLTRYLRVERPDVLVSAAIQTNLAAIWARQLARVQVRLVLTEHNVISTISTDAPMLRTRLTPGLVRRYYPQADEIIAVARGVADDLIRVMDGDAHRVHVVYNPIIGPDFRRLAAEELHDPRLRPESRPIILAVGRLHYHKDLPTLLRAFAIVRREIDAALVILGDGDELSNLSELARELQVDSAVYFLGGVPNPLPYMKRAHVLALSSMVEALSTVLIEGMAMGVPMVATDCPTGPREILCDGKYGKLVPVGDAAAMASALCEVLRSDSRPVIPREALDRFRDENVIEQYLAILDPESTSLAAGTTTVADRRCS